MRPSVWLDRESGVVASDAFALSFLLVACERKLRHVDNGARPAAFPQDLKLTKGRLRDAHLCTRAFIWKSDD